MGNVSPTPRELLTESLIFWSIGIVLYIGRMASRIIANGSIKRLYFEDYVMTVTFLIYTSLLILIQVSSQYATNLMDPADYDRVLNDPQEIRDRIIGSKIVIGLEQCMLFSTWGVKVCMLTMFWRLTKNLRLHLYVKIVAVYVAVGFVVIMVTYYAVYCRPFSQYWAMPVKDMQCATYQHYSITQAVFNITSDAAMLVVPIPLLIKTHMKKTKKVLLVCVMSLGVFTIVAAILNKVFNFASPLTTTYQIWYIREASTAIYVANLVCLWPLLRKIFHFAATQPGSWQHRVQGRRISEGDCAESQSRTSFFLDTTRLLSGSGCRRKIHGVGPAGPRGSEDRTNKVEFAGQALELGTVEPKLYKSNRDPDLEAGVIKVSRTITVT